MDKISELLEGVFYIATTEGDQPHVRPFDGVAIIDDKVYIGTKNNKKVYDQIVKNPKVEIFAMSNRGQIRFTAEAYPVEDKELNSRAYEAMGKDSSDEGAVSIELRNIQEV